MNRSALQPFVEYGTYVFGEEGKSPAGAKESGALGAPTKIGQGRSL
jgi:hypothetical protein